MHFGTLQDIKDHLSIPAYWRHKNFPNPPQKDGLYSAPDREDNHPSFSIRDNGRKFYDFARAEGGDVFDFIRLVEGVDRKQAFTIAEEIAGGRAPLPPVPPPKPRGEIKLPSLRVGKPEDFERVAKLRCIDPAALFTASRFNVLRFADVCRFPSWVLLDDALKIVEGRRMDGRPYPEIKTDRCHLVERKGHAVGGSKKDWPCGAAVLKGKPFRAVAMVEGGPDMLAAFHFILNAGAGDVLPVAMLGRGAGVRIDAQALALLAGRRVRIYPHADADGGGVKSAHVWAQQLHAVGCTVDLFSFQGLMRRDGKPVKDLNDAVVIDAAQERELEGILP
jgi:hypothetical protein